MSDRPSTEADRLVEAGKDLKLDADLAVHALESMLYHAAAVHYRNVTEKLAEVLLGVRFQTDDGVVQCEAKGCGKLFESTGDDSVMTRAAKGPSMSSPGEPPEYEVMCPECRDKDDDLYAYDEGDYAEERDA